MEKLHLPELPLHIAALTKEADIVQVETLSAGWWESPARCLICGGKGTFIWKARNSVEWWSKKISCRPEEAHTYECPCVDQFILYRRLLLANIPLNYQTLSIWDMSSDEHKGFLIDHLVGLAATMKIGLGLLLRGSPGTGKTMTAALLAKGAVMMGYSVYYDTFSGILDRFSKTWRNDAAKAYFESQVVTANLLVIDDIGRETRQSYKADVMNMAKGFLSECLRKRTQSMAPVYLTTNQEIEDLGAGYGMDVFSLLFERMDIKHFRGEDFRPQFNKRVRQEALAGLSRPVVAEVRL